MDGILVIRKEKGYTSHDVVAKLRGILHMKKIGHTGTLDPAAEGVLPVALGRGTRLVELLTEKEKTYEAVLRLGVSTDTQDMTGTILSEKPVTVTEEEVRETVASFVGEQMQVPPMYSALKVGGKKLYELAREGKTIERKPRPVVFYEIRILDMDPPLVRISVTCSKGTYIRTLCNDIGEKLGCGGAMEELLRTQSGNFTLEESMTLSQVEEAVANGTIGEKIVSIEDVLSMYPALICTPEGDKLLGNGNPVPEELVQGGSREDVENPQRLIHATYTDTITAPKTGYIAHIPSEEVGLAAMTAGGGRETKDSVIDLSAGIVLNKKVGDFVKENEPLARLYANDKVKLEAAKNRLAGAYSFSEEPVPARPLIHGVITEKDI